MHVYFLQSQSGRRGSGNFNIHATSAEPYIRNEPTTNLGAESLFWKLFFTPPWVWFTAKGLLQPVTRQPAERTQTEKSIIDQQSNPLMCEKWLWQHRLPGLKFKMLKSLFSVKKHILILWQSGLWLDSLKMEIYDNAVVSEYLKSFHLCDGPKLQH